MSREYHRLLFVFVDGVGLAPASEINPLATTPMPALASLLGGPLTSERVVETERVLVTGLDARLGVDGLPQSATGQTALFTGVNGAKLLGRHQTAFPGATLRAAIETDSLFLKLERQGVKSTFANAYNDGYLEKLANGNGRASVTTRAMEAARLPFRTVDDLLRGEAVTWDIERDIYSERMGQKVEPIAAELAGRHLAGLAQSHALTVFETFITDVAGHGRWGVTPKEALRRVDGLLEGVLAAADPALTILITSDHGNIEDATTRSHTLNPVPLVVAGPLARRFGDLTSIDQITPRLVELLTQYQKTTPI